jgi:hypothetical protein
MWAFVSTTLRRIPRSEMALTAALAAWLIADLPVPSRIATLLSSMTGTMCMVMLSLVLLGYAHPVLGILGMVATAQLLWKCAQQLSSQRRLAEYAPTQAPSLSPFTPTHPFPYTLEQEMVRLRGPMPTSTPTFWPVDRHAPAFKPRADATHAASVLSEESTPSFLAREQLVWQ